MHNIQVHLLLHPSLIHGMNLSRRAVAVFDVLRATTTITAALAAGVNPIYVFQSIQDARDEAALHQGLKVLAGESNCLPPDGFDLGNSPGAFNSNVHAGRAMFMATTNGTRALVAASAAPLVLAASLVNASAVAAKLAASGMDILLLCAGTNNLPSMEDLVGCGAVIDELKRHADLAMETDLARVAERLFQAVRTDLQAVLSDAQGGRNVLAADLAEDIAFASRLNQFQIVGQLLKDPLRIVPAWP